MQAFLERLARKRRRRKDTAATTTTHGSHRSRALRARIVLLIVENGSSLFLGSEIVSFGCDTFQERYKLVFG